MQIKKFPTRNANIKRNICLCYRFIDVS